MRSKGLDHAPAVPGGRPTLAHGPAKPAIGLAQASRQLGGTRWLSLVTEHVKHLGMLRWVKLTRQLDARVSPGAVRRLQAGPTIGGPNKLRPGGSGRSSQTQGQAQDANQATQAAALASDRERSTLIRRLARSLKPPMQKKTRLGRHD